MPLLVDAATWRKKSIGLLLRWLLVLALLNLVLVLRWRRLLVVVLLLLLRRLRRLVQLAMLVIRLLVGGGAMLLRILVVRRPSLTLRRCAVVAVPVVGRVAGLRSRRLRLRVRLRLGLRLSLRIGHGYATLLLHGRLPVPLRARPGVLVLRGGSDSAPDHLDGSGRGGPRGGRRRRRLTLWHLLRGLEITAPLHRLAFILLNPKPLLLREPHPPRFFSNCQDTDPGLVFGGGRAMP